VGGVKDGDIGVSKGSAALGDSGGDGGVRGVRARDIGVFEVVGISCRVAGLDRGGEGTGKIVRLLGPCDSSKVTCREMYTQLVRRSMQRYPL
jgi:hypothetical protein